MASSLGLVNRCDIFQEKFYQKPFSEQLKSFEFNTSSTISLQCFVLTEYRTLAVTVSFSHFWFIHSPRAVESGKTMTNYTSRSPRLISAKKEGTQNQVHKKSCKRTADSLILIHDYTLGCLHSVACFACLHSVQLQ
jgi:hypothetical protein